MTSLSRPPKEGQSFNTCLCFHEPSNANNQSTEGPRLTRRVPALRGVQNLKKTVICKIGISGTVGGPLLMQKSSTCPNISQKLRQWDLRDPCTYMLLNILQQQQPIVQTAFNDCQNCFLNFIWFHSVFANLSLNFHYLPKPWPL